MDSLYVLRQLAQAIIKLDKRYGDDWNVRMEDSIPLSSVIEKVQKQCIAEGKSKYIPDVDFKLFRSDELITLNTLGLLSHIPDKRVGYHLLELFKEEPIG